MIFQDPMTALDPVYTIGAQIVEVVVTHEGTSHAAARARARDSSTWCRFPQPTAGSTPIRMSCPAACGSAR